MTKPTIDDLIQEGLEAIANQDTQKAEAAFLQATDLYPDRFEGFTNLGSMFQAMKNHKKAIDAYQQALKRNPQHYDSSYCLGLSYAATGQWEEALEQYTFVLQHEPEREEALLAQGYAYKQAQKNDLAEDSFQKFLDLADKSSEYRPQVHAWLLELSNDDKDYSDQEILDMAREAYKRKDGQQMLFWFEQYLQRHPDDGEILAQRATFFQMLGEPSKADADLEKSKKLAPDSPFPLYHEGRILLLRGKQEEAKDCFERLVQRDPDWGDPFFQLAMLSTDNAETLSLLSKAIQKDPALFEAYVERAKIKHETGDYLGALNDYANSLQGTDQHDYIYERIEDIFSYLDKEVEQYPKDIQRIVDRAHAHLNIQQSEESIRDWSSAIKLDPKNDKLFRGRAEAYIQAGQITQAVNDLGKAIQMNPESPDLYFERAKLLVSTMQNEFALQDLNDALQIEAKGEFYLLRGKIYRSQEQWEEAEADFRKAVESGNTYPELYRELAMIHLHQQDLEEAIRYYQMVFEQERDYDTLLDAAYVYNQMEAPEQALPLLMEAAAIGSDMEEVWNDLAQTQLQLQMEKEALHSLTRSLRILPSQDEPWLLRARIYAARNDWKNALQDISRFLTRIPDFPEALLIKGKAQYHLGAMEAAQKSLSLYVELSGAPDPEAEQILEKIPVQEEKTEKKSWWKRRKNKK